MSTWLVTLALVMTHAGRDQGQYCDAVVRLHEIDLERAIKACDDMGLVDVDRCF